MALLFAEHTATVYAVSETPDTGTRVVPVPDEAAGVEISCTIEQIRSDVVLDSRTGAELMNPHRMYVEPADIEKVQYGNRVVWEDTSEQFRVTRRPNNVSGGTTLSDMAYGVVEMEHLEIER